MKLRVRVLSISGKGRKIHKSQEIINESDLPNGNAEELIEKGYLAIVEDDDNITQDVPQESTEHVAESIEAEQSEDETPGVVDYDKITKKELVSFLDEKEIAYNPRANKAELYELYKENF